MGNRQSVLFRKHEEQHGACAVFPSEVDPHQEPSVVSASSAVAAGPVPPSVGSAEISLRDRLEHACFRLENDGAGPARLNQLAEFLGVSARHANRCFRAAGLSSPMKELRRRRLKDALDRIRYSSRTLEEIAAEFDYYDGSSLSRALKRAFGISPMLLRDGRPRMGDGRS
jgi:AraC-like DNA-binding protein